MATIPTIPPVGISNLGNTCYINAVLQCIRACKSVTNIIESVANTLAMENNKELHLAPELHDIFKIMNGGSGVNPSRFIHFLRTSKLLGSEFNVQHPNDMVEFFISLQHILEKQERNVTDAEKTDETDETEEVEILEDTAWASFLKKHNSPFTELFNGQFEQTLTCSACNHKLYSYEPFSMWMLDIPINESKKPISLEDCVKRFMEPEDINQDQAPNEGWKCDACHVRGQPAYKSLKFKRMPSLLVISLKRFEITASGYKKNQTAVSMPKYIDSSVNKCRYELKGVAIHSGVMNGGHCVAMCQDGDQNWFHYDDGAVSRIEWTDVESSQPYLLFYTITSDQQELHHHATSVPDACPSA